MDIGKSIQQSVNLYTKNFVNLFVATLIAGVLSTITLGILAGPLVGGVIILSLKLIRGEKGKFSEVFAHFDQFVPTFIITIVLWVISLIIWVIASIPFIGWIIQLIVGPAIGFLYFLTLGFVVDQKMKPIEALQRSVDCFTTQPLLLWVYSLIIMIIAGIGAILFVIGVILTMPIGMAGMVVVYQQLSTKETPLFKLGKQILQIAGIAMAVLFIIGIASMIFGFGRNSKSNLASKILSGATGQKVVINEGKNKKISIGNLSVGAGLPENFPSDIPIYPKAEVGGFLGGKGGKLTGSTTTLTSEASASDICDYYVTNLKDKGWTVTISELGEMKMVNFQKEQRAGVITINPGDSECDILIGITTE